MNIGFIGLGTMGREIAANILKAGYALTIHDKQPKAAKSLLEGGVSWADTPKATANFADILFTCLPGPPEVEAVALGEDGIIEGIRPGAVYIDLSSSSPQLARRMYALFKEKGVHVMDSPMTGGWWKARDGTLRVIVSGDEAVFQQCKPVMEKIAGTIVYAGGIGNATICKLMHNCMGLGIKILLAECLTLGAKAGVDPEVLWQSVNVRVSDNDRHALSRTYFLGDFDDPTFKLRLSFKDIDLATSLGREFNVPMAMANLARQEYITAMNRGWGDKDVSVAMQLQEERAGWVKVRFSDKKAD
ncbi:NAD(P)-dependent oxidoreductase [Chloroflexota bacterium]